MNKLQPNVVFCTIQRGNMSFSVLLLVKCSFQTGHHLNKSFLFLSQANPQYIYNEPFELCFVISGNLIFYILQYMEVKLLSTELRPVTRSWRCPLLPLAWKQSMTHFSLLTPSTSSMSWSLHLIKRLTRWDCSKSYFTEQGTGLFQDALLLSGPVDAGVQKGPSGPVRWPPKFPGAHHTHQKKSCLEGTPHTPKAEEKTCGYWGSSSL